MKKKLLENALKLFAGEKVLSQLSEIGEEALRPNYAEEFVTIYGQDLKSLKVNGELITIDQLFKFKKEYLSDLSTNIIKYHGYIISYESDFIWAYWESKNKSHAISACKCASESIKIAHRLTHKWQKSGISDIVSKIGIVTGNAFVRNIGSDYCLQYSLFGDQVNFMYRLVDANNTFQTQILISQPTKDIVEKDISVQKVDEIMIKGKRDPQVLYTII